MNKQLLIVLLAVCLVSTHAFVKRDAPLADVAKDLQAQLDIAKAKLEELVSKVNADVTANLNPDTLKKNFNDLVDATNKALNSFKPAEATKPAA